MVLWFIVMSMIRGACVAAVWSPDSEAGVPLSFLSSCRRISDSYKKARGCGEKRSGGHGGLIGQSWMWGGDKETGRVSRDGRE